MKKSKKKVCKIPGCNKEVFDSKYLFCGYHQQEFQQFMKNAKIVLGGVGTVGLVVLNFINSYTTNKKS